MRETTYLIDKPDPMCGPLPARLVCLLAEEIHLAYDLATRLPSACQDVHESRLARPARSENTTEPTGPHLTADPFEDDLALASIVFRASGTDVGIEGTRPCPRPRLPFQLVPNACPLDPRPHPLFPPETRLVQPHPGRRNLSGLVPFRDSPDQERENRQDDRAHDGQPGNDPARQAVPAVFSAGPGGRHDVALHSIDDGLGDAFPKQTIYQAEAVGREELLQQRL